jgi:hypothetical protein
VRRFGLGLQLALLVSCGVASGYAWRAALSSGQAPQTQYIYGGKPFAPSWFSSPPSARVIPNAHAPANRRPKVHRATSADAAAASTSGTKSASASRQLASVTTSPQAASSSPSPASASPTPRHKGPSHPRHHSPPPPPPAPPQPPTPPQTPPPSPPSPPAPPLVTPPPPSVATVQTDPDKAFKPGWGHGDPNHEHTGPPGKGRKSEATPSIATTEATPSIATTGDDQSKGKGRSK